MTARELKDKIYQLCVDNGYRLRGCDGWIVIETSEGARDGDAINECEWPE